MQTERQQPLPPVSKNGYAAIVRFHVKIKSGTRFAGFEELILSFIFVPSFVL